MTEFATKSDRQVEQAFYTAKYEGTVWQMIKAAWEMHKRGIKSGPSWTVSAI